MLVMKEKIKLVGAGSLVSPGQVLEGRLATRVTNGQIRPALLKVMTLNYHSLLPSYMYRIHSVK
jgi:hypothetical protein